MAQKVLVQLVDDLDGLPGDDVSTVQFGLDGVTYEIDLSGANAERLRDTLTEFVAAGRRVGGRIKRGTKPRSTPDNGPSEASQVREWANNNGYELSSRGRIPAHIVDSYRQAQAEATRSKKKRSTSGAGRSPARAKAS
jgi:Lsr2